MHREKGRADELRGVRCDAGVGRCVWERGEGWLLEA
jgi:hypothetical protein